MLKKALLLSTYDAESHQHWHQFLTNSIKEYDWTVISLPARHFFWRIRSNGLSLALHHRKRLSAGYDVLVATSMVDLATLRGLVPELATVPALVYFHENQFEYPLRYAALEQRLLNAQLSSIVTALSANRVLFNSEYNRHTFLSGTRKFIKRMPDGMSPDILSHIKRKSAVLPVPIATKTDVHSNISFCTTKSGKGKDINCVDLIWAHRWEYDKQPEIFFDALEKLYNMPDFKVLRLDVRLHIMGQSFRKMPDCFKQAKNRSRHNIETWGYQKRDEYYRILTDSDFVISTALHDFQGLGMLEAIHRGCIPVAPNRVAYPEYIPAAMLYETGLPDQESTALANKLCQMLTSHQREHTGVLQAVPDVSAYLHDQLISRYEDEIQSLLI